MKTKNNKTKITTLHAIDIVEKGLRNGLNENIAFYCLLGDNFTKEKAESIMLWAKNKIAQDEIDVIFED